MRTLVNSNTRRRNSDISFECGGVQKQKDLPLKLLPPGVHLQQSLVSAKIIRTKTESDDKPADTSKILKSKEANLMMRRALRLRPSSRLPSMDNSICGDRLPTGSGSDRNNVFEFNKDGGSVSAKQKDGLPPVLGRKASLLYVQLHSQMIQEGSEQKKSDLDLHNTSIGVNHQRIKPQGNTVKHPSIEVKRRPLWKQQTLEQSNLLGSRMSWSSPNSDPFASTLGQIKKIPDGKEASPYALKDSIVLVSRKPTGRASGLPAHVDKGNVTKQQRASAALPSVPLAGKPSAASTYDGNSLQRNSSGNLHHKLVPDALPGQRSSSAYLTSNKYNKRFMRSLERSLGNY